MIPVTACAWLLALAPVQDKPAPPWEELRSVEGSFSVLLPGKPEQQTQPLQEGKVKLSYVSHVVSQGQMTYLVSFTIYPPEMRSDPDRKAAAALRGFLRSVKGKAGPEKKTPLGGASLATSTFEVEESGMVGEVRIGFIAGRLYQLVAMGPKDKYQKDDVKKALDSFKLLDEPKK